jgi:hypothetical protein
MGGLVVHETDGLAWRKSDRCDSNSCVEIAFADERVLIRNSTAPDVRLSLSRREWNAFVSWATASGPNGADGAQAA